MTGKEPVRITVLEISQESFAEIRRKIAKTNGGLIDDRVPEIEMDGIVLRPEPK